MLMDLFYDDVKIEQKERHHFNEFMLSFHASKIPILIEQKVAQASCNRNEEISANRVSFEVV
jgi:predicted ATPase